MITQQELKELLSYDPRTGLFTWLVPRKGVKAGTVAGTLGNRGYRQVMINGKLYLEHRLAWLYVHGVWPPEFLDHKNGIRRDNCIANIRLATNAQNSHNTGKSATNTSGFKGVYFDNPTRKWRARCWVEGKYKHLGLFSAPELASEAYQAFAKEHHGEFFHTEEK